MAHFHFQPGQLWNHRNTRMSPGILLTYDIDNMSRAVYDKTVHVFGYGGCYDSYGYVGGPHAYP